MIYKKMGICKKPSLDISEDIVGNNNNFFWLLDGATPPIGELNHRHTIYFVNQINNALVKYSDNSTNTQELLYKALVEIKNIFEENGLTKYPYLPCATIVIVKISNSYIEYSILGDSVLGIRINDNLQIISDNRLEKIAVYERNYVNKLRQLGINEESEQYLFARKKLIESENKYRNIDGGYWVASIQPDAVNHTINGKINVCDKDNFILMMVSDGLERLVSVFNKYNDICEVGDMILDIGEEYIFSQLRELESDKRNFLKLVASKNDDASYILITR